MDFTDGMLVVEAFGWAASLLTIATYSVRTMLPLRILAIVSSLCFVTYAVALELWPLLAMELTLLPINIYRLWQVQSLRGSVLKASGSDRADFSIVKAYGKRRQIDAGAVVFERGDPVDHLYLIATGRVRIEDVGITLSEGDIFGEIGFFTQATTRTATVRCIERAEVYTITQQQFMRLQFQDPSFGLAMMRTITQRLVQNAGHDRAASVRQA